MKKYVFLLIFLRGWQVFAQTWNVNVLTDSISINSPYSDTRNILFSNRQMRYTDPVKKFGIHFRNGLVNQMANKVTISNLFGSPILGAHGQGTELRYGGNFSSDGGQSFPSLVVSEGGKIVFEPQAKIDLVLPGSFFTRQFWILGDGTGAVEFAPGFIADRTNLGQVDSGLGSIRLSNCRLITHESQGLPLGYRPNPSLINAHLVFENEAGSRWITRTNPQDYRGGLWIRKSMTLETETDLTISGVRSVWSDYTNFGGVFFEDTSLVLAKEGSAKFIISGEQAYARNSRMEIRNGTVEFQTNPFSAEDSAFYAQANRPSGQNLAVELSGQGKVFFKALTNKIRVLKSVSPETEVHVQTGSKVETHVFAPAGIFRFIPASGFIPSAGDSFQVFVWQQRNGFFSQLVLPALSAGLVWDTARFYSEGILKINALNPVDPVFETTRLFEVFPNPAQSGLVKVRLNSSLRGISILDTKGKKIGLPQTDKRSKQPEEWQLPHLQKGVYFLQGESISGRLFWQKLLVE